jgi:hypothetical protein
MLSTADVNSMIRDRVLYLVGTSWASLALVNAWTNYGSGYAPAAWSQVGDEIYLRGMVTGGASGTTITTMPVGTRPPYTVLLPVLCMDQQGRLDVFNDGRVVFTSLGTTGWVELDQVKWMVN